MFRGVMIAMVTPIDDNSRLNISEIGKLVHRYEEAGVHGFFVGGTGGEGIWLSVDERKTLLEEIMRVKKPESKIIVHSSAFSEGDASLIMAHAKDVGADAVALLPPGYFSPLDDEAVIQYYQRFCEVAELPVIIYHLPSYSHFRISYGLFDRLMEIKNLIGIKDSNGEVHQIYRFINHKTKPVVFNGIDHVNLASMLNGASGMISAPANAMPELYVDLWNAVRREDMAKAASTQQKINAVLTEIYQYAFVPAIKQIVEWQGYSVGRPKSPARGLTAMEQEGLFNRLKTIDFL